MKELTFWTLQIGRKKNSLILLPVVHNHHIILFALHARTRTCFFYDSEKKRETTSEL